jgi:hypothetical protein
MRPVRWIYGITTVPERVPNLLQQTIASLAAAGFDKPYIFCDGYSGLAGKEHTAVRIPELSATRTLSIRGNAWGNWLLGMWELYVREPDAHRYAMFQDDIVVSKNLRAYLERCRYPENSYLNLYTCAQGIGLNNVDLHEGQVSGHTGWYLSNQMGRGALALVFDRTALQALLSSPHCVQKTACANRGWRCIDGGVCEAMSRAGFKEWIHWPSLVNHVGQQSTLGNHIGPKANAESFRGEQFDLLTLLETRT